MLGIFTSLFSTFAQIKEISFYEVRPAPSLPVIDGKLNDPAWKYANVHNAYYEYWKSNPGPGSLKTEFRMLYDVAGIYLGITNYGPTKNIRKEITNDDNQDLWTDNCAELYFDPDANAIGYTKFMGNAIGTKADCRQLDTAVYLKDWSSYGWQLKTDIQPDYWTLELFLSWSDLGKEAHPGDFWQFSHMRYDWIEKKYIGVVSSPGANTNCMDLMGWLYFSDGKTVLNPQTIGMLLARRISPPWMLIQNGKVVIFKDGKLFIDELKKMEEAANREYEFRRDEIKALAPVGKHQKEFDALNKRVPEGLKELQSLNQSLENLKWKIKVERIFN